MIIEYRSHGNKAWVVYSDEEGELVAYGDHRLRFEGPKDGYCYVHDSYDCCDSFTKEDWQELCWPV